MNIKKIVKYNFPDPGISLDERLANVCFALDCAMSVLEPTDPKLDEKAVKDILWENLVIAMMYADIDGEMAEEAIERAGAVGADISSMKMPKADGTVEFL